MPSTLTVIQETLELRASTKAKTGMIAGAVILLTLGTATWLVTGTVNQRTQPSPGLVIDRVRERIRGYLRPEPTPHCTPHARFGK